MRMRKVSPVVSNDSAGGQWMPWYCADAQASLGLRCPHMPEDTFLHVMVTSQVIWSLSQRQRKKMKLAEAKTLLQKAMTLNILPASTWRTFIQRCVDTAPCDVNDACPLGFILIKIRQQCSDH